MTTPTPHRSSRPRRRGLLAAVIVAAIGIAIATPGLLRNFGPWADATETTQAASAGLPTTRPGRAADAGLEKLEQRVKDNPEDFAAHLTLATAYVQKGRETGDPAYQSKTDEVLKAAERLDPGHPELLALRGILALARHDFAGALALGKQALDQDPERARYYGIVADAQVELGLYEDAVNSLQEMVNRRPDFEAYSRIAYVRELHGDLEGAIEAMQFAIEAGASAPESVAWAHVQVGNRYFELGRLDEASREYDAALATVKDYASAYAGQAEIAAARGDLTKAAALFQQALDQSPTAHYAIALGDVAGKQGDAAKAASFFTLARELDRVDAANGTNTDLELARFLVERDLDPGESLSKARAAYSARPSVDGADVLAWALFKAGKTDEAEKYAMEALRLNTRDSVKLFHAAMIQKALGKKPEAKALLEQATNLNPRFSLLHADAAAAALQELRGS
ncbi:MAG: tetratricopeptide repeat protein [Dehalococcoidia bacterium]